MTGTSCVILGAGGHARVVADTVLALGWKLGGCVAPQRPDLGIADCPYLGDDAAQVFAKNEIVLANGIGSVGSTRKRRDVFLAWHRRGFRFPPIGHPGATIARDAVLCEGAIVIAGAVVQAGAWLADNALVNTGAVVDHDSRVGAHSHVATGAILCGNVILGDGVHVGAGATIVQGVKVGNNAVIGAGSVVLKDVPDGVVAVGIPARITSHRVSGDYEC